MWGRGVWFMLTSACCDAVRRYDECVRRVSTCVCVCDFGCYGEMTAVGLGCILDALLWVCMCMPPRWQRWLVRWCLRTIAYGVTERAGSAWQLSMAFACVGPCFCELCLLSFVGGQLFVLANVISVILLVGCNTTRKTRRCPVTPATSATAQYCETRTGSIYRRL